MSTEQLKAVLELAVFREFVEKSGLPIDRVSVSKPGGESEPDIFCNSIDGEPLAFELAEICAPEIAAAIAKASSAAVITGDCTASISQKKLHKAYRTDRPIELVFYTNGRTVSLDEWILETARNWAGSVEGPFRRVWLLGSDGLHEVWSAS